MKEICLGTLLPHLLPTLARPNNVAKYSLSRHPLPVTFVMNVSALPLLLPFPSLFCAYGNTPEVLTHTLLDSCLSHPKSLPPIHTSLLNPELMHLENSDIPQTQPGTAEFISFYLLLPFPFLISQPHSYLMICVSCKSYSMLLT